MLGRLGLQGAKRLKAAFGQGWREHATHQSLPSSGDGLEGIRSGAGHSRLCSTLTNGYRSAAGNAQGAAADTQPSNRAVHDAPQRTQCSSSSPVPRTSFLQHASADAELHERLAALWGMPSELLFERQQAVAKMLGPAGCGTPVHALWLLVRAPQLRHASEAALRHSLRQLHRLVSHADIDRAAVLTAVYKYPWIVEAMADQDTQAAAAAGPPPQQQQHAAAAGRQQQQQPAAAVAPAATTWLQELAAVVLELQQADHAEYVASGGKASRGLRMSPTFAAAAVCTYLAVGEVKQVVSHAASSVANRLLDALPGPTLAESAAAAAAEAAAQSTAAKAAARSSSSRQAAADPCSSATPSPPPAAVAGSPPSASSEGPLCPPSQPSPAAAARYHTSSSHVQQQQQQRQDACSAMGEVLAQLQQQQQQHLLLQQLLVACPHLTALPPELLLARYERLEAVVEGCTDAAQQLVVANPFLMVTYNDNAAARAEAQALRHSYA